jgi:hypothetical protein
VGHGERDRVLERWWIFFVHGLRLHTGSIVQEDDWPESWGMDRLVMDHALDVGMGKPVGRRLGEARTHWEYILSGTIHALSDTVTIYFRTHRIIFVNAPLAL